MVKDKSLKIRLDTEEYEKLQAYADLKKVSMAHILREYVRRLPNPQSPRPPLTPPYSASLR